MTTEQRLSEWLHEHTPQPPARVTLADIASRVRAERHAPPPRNARARTWLTSVAAAAVVALLAAVLVSIESTQHRSDPGTPSPSPNPTHTLRSTLPTPPALTFRPWNARLIVSEPSTTLNLTAIGSYLYRIRDDLERIDPGSGRVVARQPLTDDETSGIAAAAGLIWAAARTATHAVTLTGYDLLSLRPLVRRTYTFTGRFWDVALASRRATLYLAAGKNVLVVNATTLRSLTMTVSDGVDSVSATPDGRWVVVATNNPNGQGAIEVVDARGQRLTRRAAYGCGELLAVSTGYYATCGQAHNDSVGFYPFDGSAPSSGVEGGGGIGSTAQVSGGVVWLGSTQEAACADPATGRIRARVALSGPDGEQAALTDLSVADGRLYAVYTGTNNLSGVGGLVELTPPKACGLT